MKNENTATASSESTPAQGRRYKEIYMVEDSHSGRGFWTKIGVAFETRGGNLSLKLNAVPVGGARVIVCEPRPRVVPGEAGDGAAANDNAEQQRQKKVAA